eukprot:TRINITY_DN1639_c0_g1_i4.p1 TRINITY_DN1639_c0_g1~~TRINITY_DN1639_c0_g1_i4.p1  ORF type:complete len:429 (+),score=102.94 TRINITY_DN1639_c0_g1_i4:147-1433(+)
MISNKLSIKDIRDEDIKGRRVVMRVDFNVPINENKGIDPGSTQRIDATIPTIKYAFQRGANNVVLMSHLGRPDGEEKKEYSLLPVFEYLSAQLPELKVEFVEKYYGGGGKDGPNAEKVRRAPHGTVILLENLRFHKEEEAKAVDGNVQAFRDLLTSFGEVYVNDAFGTAHRPHSSVVGIRLPLRAAGLLMEKELEYFGKVLEQPKRPLLAILGGAKVSDKILLINNLIDKVDELIIGGAMAFTFKYHIEKARVGNSLCEKDDKAKHTVEGVISKAAKKEPRPCILHFPIDFVVADKKDEHANIDYVTDKQGIQDGWLGLDCGPESNRLFHDVVSRARTIVWNGPMGVFEIDKFAKGTESLMRAVIEATEKEKDPERKVISIIGGGDTAIAAEKFGAAGKVSHISTGGGASLELLEGKELPGVTALSNK